MTSKQKRSFARDVHYLHKKIDSMSGGQARVVDFEDAKLMIEIIPSDGHYKGGKWKFTIFGGDVYPSMPPTVRCNTEIYHPNIDMEEDGVYDEESESNICVSLLEEGEWNESMTLEDCIQGILFLFYNPNWSDALSPMFSCDMTEEEFAQNVVLSLKGGDVDGYEFQTNYGFIEMQENETEVELVNEMNKLNTEKTEELVLERIDSIIDTSNPDIETQGQTTQKDDIKQEEITQDSQTEIQVNDIQKVEPADDESVKVIISLLDKLIQDRKEANDTAPQEADSSGRLVRRNSAPEVLKRSTSQTEQPKVQDGGTLSKEDTIISPEKVICHDENIDVWKQLEDIAEKNEVVDVTKDNKDKSAMFVFDNLIPGCEILPVLNAYVCEKLFEGS